MSNDDSIVPFRPRSPRPLSREEMMQVMEFEMGLSHQLTLENRAALYRIFGASEETITEVIAKKQAAIDEARAMRDQLWPQDAETKDFLRQADMISEEIANLDDDTFDNPELLIEHLNALPGLPPMEPDHENDLRAALNPFRQRRLVDDIFKAAEHRRISKPRDSDAIAQEAKEIMEHANRERQRRQEANDPELILDEMLEKVCFKYAEDAVRAGKPTPPTTLFPTSRDAAAYAPHIEALVAKARTIDWSAPDKSWER